MEKLSVEKVYALLDKFKDDDKVKVFLENIDFFENVCNYVLSQPKVEYDQNTKLSYVDESVSFNVAKEILLQLSPNYLELFNKYEQEGSIKKEDERANKHGSGIAQVRDGKIELEFGLHYDINDIFLIIHEFIHSLNIMKNDLTEKKELFSESFSVYSEFLIVDYLQKNNIAMDENKDIIKLRMSELYKRFARLKEYINIIKYNNQNGIDTNCEIYIDDRIDFLASIDYSFAGIVAYILFNRNINGLFSNEEYMRLAEKIKWTNKDEMMRELFPDGLDINEYISGYERVVSLINNENIDRNL